MKQNQVEVLKNVGRASSLTELAKLSGVDRGTISIWLKDDEEFVADYKKAKDVILEEVKDAAIFGVGGVLDALREAAMDKDHPQQSQMIREYMRILEKWTGKKQTLSGFKWEMNFDGQSVGDDSVTDDYTVYKEQ